MGVCMVVCVVDILCLIEVGCRESVVVMPGMAVRSWFIIDGEKAVQSHDCDNWFASLLRLCSALVDNCFTVNVSVDLIRV